MLANAITEKEIKDIYIKKEEIKLFADNMIICVENSEESYQKFPIVEFSKIAGLKISTQNLIMFLHVKQWKIGNWNLKKYYLEYLKKNEILSYQFNKICTWLVC